MCRPRCAPVLPTGPRHRRGKICACAQVGGERAGRRRDARWARSDAASLPTQWSKKSKKRKQHIPDGKSLVKMLKELDASEYKQHLREAMGEQRGGGAQDSTPQRGKSAKNLRRSGSSKGGSRLTRSKSKAGKEEKGKDRGKGKSRGKGQGEGKGKGGGSSQLNRRWATQARRLGKKGAAGVPGPRSPAVAKAKEEGSQSRGVAGGDDEGEFAPPRNTLGAFSTPSGIPKLNIAKVEQQRQRDEARRHATKKRRGGEKPPLKDTRASSKSFFGSLLHRPRPDKERAKRDTSQHHRKASTAGLSRTNSKAHGHPPKRAPLRRADSALPVGYLTQVKDQEEELFEAAKMDAMAASGSAFAASKTGSAGEEKGQATSGDHSEQEDKGLVVMESHERHAGTDAHQRAASSIPAPARRDHQVVPAANKRRSSVTREAPASRFVVGNA